ncbi:MAG: riboflavin biosynthesis protein RibF [Opitutales bacterium]
MNPLRQFSGLAAVQLPGVPVHLAIGMFDGVHLGHRAVIEPVVQAARASGGLAAVLTFWPHPSVLFSPQKPTRLIMPRDAKARVMERLGVDVMITEEFTPDFARIRAEDFLPWLRQHVPQLAALYVGDNWRFGCGRSGDSKFLQREAAAAGLKAASVPQVSAAGSPVSSTRIRHLLVEGKIGEANALLGDTYFAEGLIAPGKGLGRQIGFPTLNVAWLPELTPRFGVYAVRLGKPRGEMSRSGVANYGVRPTVEQTLEPRLEVHVLGDCPFAAGDSVRVEWRHFLRPETKFENVDALRRQIAQDRQTAVEWFAHSPA